MTTNTSQWGPAVNMMTASSKNDGWPIPFATGTGTGWERPFNCAGSPLLYGRVGAWSSSRVLSERKWSWNVGRAAVELGAGTAAHAVSEQRSLRPTPITHPSRHFLLLGVLRSYRASLLALAPARASCGPLLPSLLAFSHGRICQKLQTWQRH